MKVTTQIGNSGSFVAVSYISKAGKEKLSNM
jgi:hypothetical protein